jgi:hypothetical protein
LAAPFDRSVVKFKPAVVQGNRALALAYVDARVIQDRLDYDAKLAAQGVCAVGDLLWHLAKLGEKAGHGSDLTRWNGDAIAWAAQEVRAFKNAR